MTDVFISYSRRDIAFARLIQESLQKSEVDTWIDWERIPVGEKWWQEICEAIENANIFMFILSKHSIGSEVCRDEINHALKNNKRIIPIIIDHLEPQAVKTFAPGLPEINWVIFERDQLFLIEERPESHAGKPEERQVALPLLPQFQSALEKLNAVIHTDYEQVKFHTKLQLRALDWERHKDASRLLRGKELHDAEKFFVDVHAQKDPQPTDLQRLYIFTSRRAGEHLRRWVTIGLILGMLVLAAISLLAWQQRGAALQAANERATAQVDAQNSGATAVAEANFRATSQAQAEFQRSLTLPRQLAAQAELLRIQDPANSQLALLLAIESIKRIPSTEAESTINLIVEKMPVPVYLVVNPSPVTLTQFTRAGDKLITMGGLGDYLARRGGEEFFFRSWDFLPPYSEIVIQTPEESLARDPVWTQPQFFGDPTPVPADLSFINGATGGFVVWNNATNVQIQYSWRGDFLYSSAGLFHAVRQTDDFGNMKINIEGYYDQTNLFSAISVKTKILSATFSPDQQRIILGGEDGSLSFNAVPSGTLLNKINRGSPINALAASPDGRYLAVAGGDGVISLLSYPGLGELSRTVPSAAPTYLVFSPDGRLLAGLFDHYALIWSVPDLEELAQPTHADRISDISFSSDSRYLATGSADYSTVVWDLLADEQALDLEQVAALSTGQVGWLSPGGRYYLSIDTSGTLQVHGILDRGLLQTIFTGEIQKYGFSQNDSRLWAKTGKLGGFVWDIPSGTKLISLESETPVAISPSGRYLAVTTGDTSVGKVIDLDDPSRVIEFEKKTGWICACAFTPDDVVLVYTSCDPMGVGFGTAYLVDLVTQPGSSIVEFDIGYHQSIVISPDGRFLSGAGGVISLWDMNAVQMVSISQMGYIVHAAFSPDGLLLATASEGGMFDTNPDYSIAIWHLPEGSQVTYVLLENGINDMAFSADSKYLASASGNTAQVWDAASGVKLTERVFPASIAEIRFLPDQSGLLVSDQTNIWVWSWNSAATIKQACRHLSRNLSTAEWNYYMGDDNYQPTCPDLPSP